MISYFSSLVHAYLISSSIGLHTPNKSSAPKQQVDYNKVASKAKLFGFTDTAVKT